jgi:hypothetical protein
VLCLASGGADAAAHAVSFAHGIASDIRRTERLVQDLKSKAFG